MYNRISLLLLTLIIHLFCFSQDEKAPSKESQAYHAIREKMTIPPYGLAKIEGLIKKIKEVTDEDDNVEKAIPKSAYSSLSVREKFTYNMIHAESWSQNCDVSMNAKEEQDKIFAHFPDLFGEDSWSDRQYAFFKENKDSVIALMTESIDRTRRIGLNYKQVIVDINATKMIPLLISTYKLEKKDRDILTVLLLLMKENKYPPFIGSASYTKLYKPKEEYSYYDTWIVYNTANEDLIIQRATDFYQGHSK